MAAESSNAIKDFFNDLIETIADWIFELFNWDKTTELELDTTVKVDMDDFYKEDGVFE
jgi:hypothetical protein